VLPLSMQAPAAVVFLAGGAIACFGGYRLFRFVLGVYGFILGALVGSSIAGSGQAWATIAAAAAGGAIGALVLVAGYMVGVAVVGAGIAALAVNLGWKPFGGDPHPAVLVVAAAIGAFTAMWFQRHVIIIATAFGGAWTMLVGVTALFAGRDARAASAGGDMWVVYPNTAGPNATWVYGGWVALSLVGMYVQLRWSGGSSGKKTKQKQ
jgi:hypothetical protein